MKLHEEFVLEVPLTREQQAARLREQFPECAAFTDSMRAEFGDVEMQAMTEGTNHFQRKYHKAESEYMAVIDGETFLSMGRLIEAEVKLAKLKANNAKRK